MKLHREITRLVLSFLGALATVALLFAFSFTEPAGASTVSSVTFWPTTTAAGISSSWDVGFKTTAALPSGDKIYMLFPNSSAFPIPSSPTFTAVSGFTGTCTTSTMPSSGVSYLLVVQLGSGCSIAASTSVTFAIGGFTNPVSGTAETAGNFQLQTDTDNGGTQPSGSSTVTFTSTFPTLPVYSYPGTITNATVVRNTATGSSGLMSGVAYDGKQVWTDNYTGNDVYSVNPATGAIVNTITATTINGTSATTDINYPIGLAIDNSDLWVVTQGNSSVSEFSLSGSTDTPTFVRTVAVGTSPLTVRTYGLVVKVVLP